MSKKQIFTLLIAFVIITLSVSSFMEVKANSKIDITDPVNLRWIVVGNGEPEGSITVEKEINKYLKNKINATLDIKFFFWGDDFDQRIAVYMAAGDPYDINFAASWTANYRKYASYGTYVDITDMLDTYAPKTKALLGKDIINGAKVDGRLYALPVFNSNIVNNNDGILLNKKLVQKYNLNISKIKKLQDLEPILSIIKKKEPNIIAFSPFDSYGSSNAFNTLGLEKLNYDSPGVVSITDKTAKVINEYEDSRTIAFYKLMNKWYKWGYISKATQPTNSFYNDNKSKIFALYANIYPGKCADLLKNDGVDMLPVKVGTAYKSTASCTGAMQAISTNSKNPERALMLLELVNTDEKLSNLINYGIEGTHYKKTGAKTITQLQKSQQYSPSTTWLFGNESIVYSTDINIQKEWDSYKTKVKYAVASPILGFSFESKPVSTNIPKLKSITDKYYNDLCIGKVDPTSTLKKMNAELKKAGLDKVLAEMQKQVDTFKMTNK